MIRLSKNILAFREKLKKMRRDMGLFSSSMFKKDHHDEPPLLDIVDVDQVEHLYDHITLTSKLCDQLLQVNKERVQLLEEINEISLKRQNIKTFHELDQKDQVHIKKLWESLQASKEEKEELKGKLSDETNRDLDFIEEEQNIPKLLKDIFEAEEKQRNIQKNIHYLEGEKGALVYSKEKLQNALKIIRGVTIGAVAFFGISAFILFLAFSFFHKDILVISASMIVAGIFMGTWLYIFQRYTHHEIQKNILTQSRAVELLNKEKIKYVNITSFLEYEYKKYNIKSGDMLRYQWEKYEETRKNQNRYRGINTRIYHLENQIEKKLSESGIRFRDRISRQIEEIINMEAPKSERKDLTIESKNKEKQLERLEEQQQLIWEQLMKLQAKDHTEEKVVERLIQKYLEDMQNFVKSP